MHSNISQQHTHKLTNSILLFGTCKAFHQRIITDHRGWPHDDSINDLNQGWRNLVESAYIPMVDSEGMLMKMQISALKVPEALIWSCWKSSRHGLWGNAAALWLMRRLHTRTHTHQVSAFSVLQENKVHMDWNPIQICIKWHMWHISYIRAYKRVIHQIY